MLATLFSATVPSIPRGQMRSASRPRVPMRAQRDAALLQLGLDPTTAELDHRPALASRYRDPITGKYDPEANDPRYLRWLTPEAHAQATFRDNGSGRGDLTAIAHTRRATRKHNEHLARMQAKLGMNGAPKKDGPSRWPKRKMRQRTST